MRIGIPRGLLYDRYNPFLKRFFSELGAELVISPATNKSVLNQGLRYCIDEACLPVKVFHGHAAYLRDKCDVMLIPRIMQIYKGEFICPKFCGLPEMVMNSIDSMPEIIDEPIYATTEKRLYRWAVKASGFITRDTKRIKNAFEAAVTDQKKFRTGMNQQGYKLKIALTGHPYNIYDTFINMNVIEKLNRLGVGIVTEEFGDELQMESEVKALYKKPFWTFARKAYGFSAAAARARQVDGIIYVSSFACGIDSVVIELIRDTIGDFPLLVLKIDEHTGEAGVDTRLEAFADMLERSCDVEGYHPSHGKCLSGCQSPV